MASSDVAAGGLRLWIGPDRARKRDRLHALTSALRVSPLDQHRLSAAHVSARALDELIRAHPAASPLRLIVLDDAERLDRAGVRLLADHAERLRMIACVVLLVDRDLGASHPLRAELGARVELERFAPAAADLPRSRGRFALLEAIGRRDGAAALQALQEQVQEGKEAVEIVGALVWQLQRWLTVGQWVEAGYELARLPDAAEMTTWQLTRVRQEMRGRSVASLRRALRACWELDGAIKTGRVIPRLGLEPLIMELCRA